MCLPAGTLCDNFHEYTCGEDKAFCFTTERCFADPSLSSCNTEKPYNFIATPADYKLVHQVKYTIESPGYKLLKLDQPIHVNKGDVLGWTSAGGEISYVVVTEPPEFFYNTVTSLNEVLSRTDNPDLKYWNHILSAHYIDPAKFYLRHNYSSPGAYYIRSNITEPYLVYVDVPVGIVKVQCPIYKLSGESFTITVTQLVGTNITYSVNFDNGTVYTEKSNHFRYFYNTPGIYLITVTGYNSLSSMSDSCIIKIYDDITDLSFDGDIESVAVHHNTWIKWCVNKGTNVTYVINYEDELSDTVTDFSSNCHQINHEYEKAGRYVVTITATNDIGSQVSISSSAVVDIPITNLACIHTA